MPTKYQKYAAGGGEYTFLIGEFLRCVLQNFMFGGVSLVSGSFYPIVHLLGIPKTHFTTTFQVHNHDPPFPRDNLLETDFEQPPSQFRYVQWSRGPPAAATNQNPTIGECEEVRSRSHRTKDD